MEPSDAWPVSIINHLPVVAWPAVLDGVALLAWLRNSLRFPGVMGSKAEQVVNMRKVQ